MQVTTTTLDAGARSGAIRELAWRIEEEYAVMPGLSVTLQQAQRLWTVDRPTCQMVFDRLVARGVLRMTTKGRFVRVR